MGLIQICSNIVTNPINTISPKLLSLWVTNHENSMVTIDKTPKRLNTLSWFKTVADSHNRMQFIFVYPFVWQIDNH